MTAEEKEAKARAKLQKELERLSAMKEYERKHEDAGYICGVDLKVVFDSI